MRHYFLAIALFLTTASVAQVKSGDAQLDQRLSNYMKYNEQLDFEKMFDLIHPKIYKVAPKEQLIKVFKDAFDNEALEMAIDTIKTLAVGAPFRTGAASYRRVDYYMTMHLRFKDTTIYETPDFATTMITSLQQSFGNRVVSFDKDSKRFSVRGNDVLYAIKDNQDTPWMFIGYQKNEPLIKAIFPKDVIEHFKLL
ncbi:MAG: hypothetical protein JWP88_647 [Flaviaesturariibacter sp.]|nr:hypothetical protein [Flaviaesturariibacter sp.]